MSQNGANGIKSFFRRGKGYLTAGDFANEVRRELISEVSNACVVVQFYPKSRSKRSRYSSENDVLGSSSKTPVTKPDGTKMFRSVFLNDARRCCFFTNIIVKYYYDHIHNLVVLWKSCSMAN